MHSKYKEIIYDFYKSSCKDFKNQKIGFELESFVLDKKTRIQTNMDELYHIYKDLKKIGWVEDKTDYLRKSDLVKGGASISHEPGGQIEYSSAPQLTLHEVSDEIDEYIKDIKTALGNNYYFLPIGYNFFSPSSHKDEFFTKERYDTLLNGLGSWGKRIQAPLMKTCSFQIALDYNSMEDLEKKMVVIFHILPLISSLLSTSPLITNDQVVMKSYRYWCWNQAVPSRFGISPFIGNKYISFDLYLDYLINLDCPFTIIDGKYIENRGIFAEKSIPKDRIISDWLVHMSSVYTDARIRGYIELRSCDACSPPYMKAYTAFWTGLLYNQEALDNAYSIVKNWTVTDALNTRQASVCTGVQTPILTEIILNKLDVFFKLSYTGLKVRNKLNKLGENECIYVKPIEDLLDKKTSLADQMIKIFHTKNYDVNKLLELLEF